MNATLAVDIDVKNEASAPEERLGALNLEVKRLPPCNYEAEKALLGALLLNNASYESVSEILQADHFADAVHGLMDIPDKMQQEAQRHGFFMCFSTWI